MTEAVSLPIGWANAVLGEIAEVRLGRQRSPQRAQGPHMRNYVRAANVTWTGLDLRDVKQMDFTPAEFDVFALRHGDILVVEGSGSATEVGKPAVWRGEVTECCFQNTLIRVRAPHELVQYLLAHFKKDAITGEFARASRGIGIHHIGAKARDSWRIGVPPLPEQRRIVAKIEALQERSRAAREALEAIPPLLDRFRQSVLAAAFRGDLTADWRAQNPDVEPASVLLERIRTERRHRWEQDQLAKFTAKGKPPKDNNWKSKYKEPTPVDPEVLPELPDGWCWSSVAEVSVSHDHRRVPLRQADRRAREGRYPYYGAFGIIDRIDAFLFDGTFVLIAEDGKNLMQRTRPISLIASGKFWVNNHAHVLEPLGGMDHGYLVHHFNGADLLSSLTGIDQVKLTRGALDAVPIPVAPLLEQHELVRLCDAAVGTRHGAIESVSAGLTGLRRLDQSILAKAFRGELVPQDPNDEPASVLLDRIRAEREAATPKKKTARARRPKTTSKKRARPKPQ